MNTSTLLKIYQHLPSWARDLAATARGFYLSSWRYGPDSERLIAETLERDRWSPEQWKNWKEEHLAYVLHRAATQVPYYRELWEKRRRDGDQASWDLLENWPLLSKQEVRANPEAFVADDMDKSQMYREQTSGTTGTSLSVWWGREAVQNWFSLMETRIRRWNGVTRHQNWAILGGQIVVPTHVDKPPFWVWNRAMNQLYLSANHLSPQHIPDFVKAINEYEITHMIVYTSSATYLARSILDQGLEITAPMKFISTNAEPVFPWQREAISEAFHCRVLETYGMAEIVAGASEDSQGRLRQWPEVGNVEIVADDEDKPIPVGDAGRLVCTSLLNTDMPLVRYLVGDRGRLSEEQPDEKDTIQLPIFGTIEGRSNDLLIAPDGRRVFWLNPVFYGLPIREAQIVQKSREKITIRLVTGDGFVPEYETMIKERLAKRMGDIGVDIEHVETVPKEANGKFRPVICEVPEDQR